jgi:hypothetical protein
MTSWPHRPVPGLPGVPPKRRADIRTQRRLRESSRTKLIPQVAPKTRSSITVPQNRAKRPAHSKIISPESLSITAYTLLPRPRAGPPLFKKSAAYAAFSIQGNSMLAMRRHFVSMFFDQVLVALHLLAPLFLLQISDPHFTIEVLQQTDILCGEKSYCPLFVPDYVCLEHFRSPLRQVGSPSNQAICSPLRRGALF